MRFFFFFLTKIGHRMPILNSLSQILALSWCLGKEQAQPGTKLQAAAAER